MSLPSKQTISGSMRSEDLNQNPQTSKVLAYSKLILESEYGLQLRLGQPDYHKQSCNFLEVQTVEVEQNRWICHLWDHDIAVRDQLSKVVRSILVVKEVVSTAARASLPASIACAGIMACFTTALLIENVNARQRHEVLLDEVEKIQHSIHEHNLRAATSVRDMKIKTFLQILYTCPDKDREDINNRRVPGTYEWFTAILRPRPGGRVQTLTTLVYYGSQPMQFPGPEKCIQRTGSYLTPSFIAQLELFKDHILDKLETDGENIAFYRQLLTYRALPILPLQKLDAIGRGEAPTGETLSCYST
ncbi:uncharacterized protein BP01DRAFT_411169 [Aspergillus saccharolyticus JOP 1030-1]|uniref:Uncharacterized protein n=1 Tax=Aspergillus saccharolyticus JOP 1030-1 TaxID=1450539 RepID=A0A318ZL31_9EURO|nr:hypothetical protein BP01DRAFT_411169 [Aspergillus saccharolyticus JOP 1030-1]PYH47114.1 hypothetical protein BP01DRAFT_411169 [Aspergillus saccharolyticus JOP 1030-1]